MAEENKPSDFTSLEGKAGLLDELLTSDMRDPILKAFAKAHPDVVLPEVRTDEKVTTKLEAFEKRMLEKLDETLKERDFTSTLAAQRKAVEDRGFKLEDVETVMKDKRIGSYETAMDFLDQQNRLAPATPTDYREKFGINLPDKIVSTKEAAKIARNLSLEALSELRSGRLKN